MTKSLASYELLEFLRAYPFIVQQIVASIVTEKGGTLVLDVRVVHVVCVDASMTTCTASNTHDDQMPSYPKLIKNAKVV